MIKNKSREKGYEILLVINIIVMIISNQISKIPLMRILIVLTIIGLFFPHIFTPIRKIWIDFGALLGKVINPITLAILYVIMITPVALMLKIKDRDVLLIKRKNYVSNWTSNKTNYDLNYFKRTF
jgi:hypothetical protein